MKIPHKYDVGQKILFITETSSYVSTRCEHCNSILYTQVVKEETEDIGAIFGLKYVGQKILYLINNPRTHDNDTIFEDRVIRDLDDDEYLYMIDDI